MKTYKDVGLLCIHTIKAAKRGIKSQRSGKKAEREHTKKEREKR